MRGHGWHLIVVLLLGKFGRITDRWHVLLHGPQHRNIITLVFHEIGAGGGNRLDWIDLVSTTLALASARNDHLVLGTVALPALMV